MTPLRIGILGAARIADDGIVAPARALGHEFACVAARDPLRAEAYAADREAASTSAGTIVEGFHYLHHRSTGGWANW